MENASKVKIALFARTRNSLAAVNQKLSEGRSSKLCHKPRSCLNSVSSAPAKSCLFQKHYCCWATRVHNLVKRQKLRWNKTRTSSQVFTFSPIVLHSTAVLKSPCHFWVTREPVKVDSFRMSLPKASLLTESIYFVGACEHVFISALHSCVQFIRMLKYICHVCQTCNLSLANSFASSHFSSVQNF